jgi:ribonuclease D
VRDHIASRRDIAPGRILPDSAIIAAAQADPKTIDELLKLPVFGGPKQRRTAQVWFDALTAGRDDPDPPEASESLHGPPPSVRWNRRKPEASRRLDAARLALGVLSERLNVPTENLVSPDLVRRLCWDWAPAADTATAVEVVLRDGGARAWQREMAGPVLAAALAAAQRHQDGAARDGAQPGVSLDT